MLFKLGAEESSNEDMEDENDEDKNDEVCASDEEEKEHQKNSGINMDDYDVC